MTDPMPRPGDRVRVEIEGTWHTSLRGEYLDVENGNRLYAHETLRGASVTVVERRANLVPGQVWLRRRDGVLFNCERSPYESEPRITRSDAGNDLGGWEIMRAGTGFDPDEFQLMFDPRWQFADPNDVAMVMNDDYDYVIYRNPVE